MKILILGASGFLGSNFLKIVKPKNHEFLCLSRSMPKLKKFKFKKCDLNNILQFKKIVKEFYACTTVTQTKNLIKERSFWIESTIVNFSCISNL